MNRMHARQRLADSAAPYLLERALNMVPTPLAVFDVEGREVVRNRALKRLIGSSGDDGGLVERMRRAARDAGADGPATTRTHPGGYALRGRRLEDGELLGGSAVLVAVEPA